MVDQTVVTMMLEEKNQLKNTKFWLFFFIIGSTCSAKKWSLKTATKGTKYDISKVPNCSNVLLSKYYLKNPFIKIGFIFFQLI